MSNIDIKPRNSKGKPHGYWEVYSNDKLWFKSLYHNGKEVGYGEIYSYLGKDITKKTCHL